MGGGAEEGEAGDELEGADSAAHQVFDRDAAGELVAGGSTSDTGNVAGPTVGYTLR